MGQQGGSHVAPVSIVSCCQVGYVTQQVEAATFKDGMMCRLVRLGRVCRLGGMQRIPVLGARNARGSGQHERGEEGYAPSVQTFSDQRSK